MHRGSPKGRRPRLNWALMCAFILLAAVSVACIPHGAAPEIICAGVQIAVIGLTEMRCRDVDPDAGLWYPSRRDGFQDTAVSVIYVVTMTIELISLAVLLIF